MLSWSFKTSCPVFNVVPKSRPVSPEGLHSGRIKINPVVISGWLWGVFCKISIKVTAQAHPGPNWGCEVRLCDLGVLVREQRCDCHVCVYPQAWFTVFSPTIMRLVLQMETFSKKRLYSGRVTAKAWRDLGPMTHPNSVVVFQGNLCAPIMCLYFMTNAKTWSSSGGVSWLDNVFARADPFYSCTDWNEIEYCGEETCCHKGISSCLRLSQRPAFLFILVLYYVAVNSSSLGFRCFLSTFPGGFIYPQWFEMPDAL